MNNKKKLIYIFNKFKLVFKDISIDSYIEDIKKTAKYFFYKEKTFNYFCEIIVRNSEKKLQTIEKKEYQVDCLHLKNLIESKNEQR